MAVDQSLHSYVPRGSFRLLALGFMFAAAFTPLGCSGVFGSGASGELAVHNQNTHRVISPEIVTAAYRSPGGDQNTADVYLSDLPAERLSNLDDRLDGLSGVIVHIHLFLIPSAGSTPIDQSACNVSVRTVVLASPQPDSEALIGLYSGGGFVLPSGDPGDSSFGGSILDASLRLVSSSASLSNVFVDQLSPAQMTGKFRAPMDDEAARVLATRFERLVGRANIPAPALPRPGSPGEASHAKEKRPSGAGKIPDPSPPDASGTAQAGEVK